MLSEPQTRALHATIAANLPRVLTRIESLASIESPSNDPAAIQRAIDHLLTFTPPTSVRVRQHRNKQFGNALELRFGPARSKQKPVLLLGHLDTVWPLGTLARMPVRRKADILSGPGTLDMKAGVVMALEAVAALAEHNLLRPVTLLLVPDEEIGSTFSRPLTERLARESSAVFVLEPAQGLAYKTARKGVGHYTLTVHGVAAHAGVDFTAGHSAIHEMARLVPRITALTDLPRGATVNVGVISGGSRSNVIADTCTAEIDVRITTASNASRLDKKLRALRPTDRHCTLTLTGGINRPPMERTPGTVRLLRIAQHHARHLNLQLDEAATGGGSDGNFTAALGVPTLDGMGAVGAGAHAPHEYILISHLTHRTTLLAATITSV